MKHDKLKSECFKISSITGKQNDEDKNNNSKKQGKLKTIQKVINKNKEINEFLEKQKGDLRSMQGGNRVRGMTKKKLASLTMSNAHLARLHKIKERFQRDEQT